MNTVILTIGPQHVGKSTFCKKMLEKYPNLLMVSRDKILVEMFGSAYLSPYEGGHFAAMDRMYDDIKSLVFSKTGQLIILDCWNGPNQDRRNIISVLRSFGVENIGGWYFKTSLDQCLIWERERFLRKEKAKPSKSEEWKKRKWGSAFLSFIEFYNYFYNNADPEKNDFDFVVQINPLRPYVLSEIVSVPISEPAM